MSFSFKRSEVPASEDGDFSPIPPGQYDVHFEDLKEKETQAGGIQWSAMMKIDGPSHAGRTFWINWNVVNASDKAQEIARREVSQIADLLGLGDDISIVSLKTNTKFSIVLEQKEYMGKIQYNAKNWKLAEKSATTKNFQTGTAKADAPKAPAKKAAPWQK